MRALIQRVKKASVTVEGKKYGSIDRGLLVLLGIHKDDELHDAKWLAKKTSDLRIFPNDSKKMDLSVQDIRGDILVVSQFTLYGRCQKGNRPDFLETKAPEEAQKLYQSYVEILKNFGLTVATGLFGAMMEVDLVNEGPCTLLIETKGK